MKRSAPLSRNSTLKRTPLKRGNSTLKRTGFKQKSYEEVLASTKEKAASKSSEKPRPKLKSYGMTGRGRTAGDKQFHSSIVGLGCFACRVTGRESTSPLQVHHIRGRNKGNCVSERLCVCLCSEHHDQTTFSGYFNGSVWVPADRSLPGPHHAKKRFIEQIGTELWCVHETMRLLNECPVWLTDAQWSEYLALLDQSDQELWLQGLGRIRAVDRVAA